MKTGTAITVLTPLACLAALGNSGEAASRKAGADLKQDAAGKPNVLVIMVDQMAAWTLGAYGGREIGTPHIDSLAREGAVVTGFYASTPVCTPSRGSFMTGLYPNEHGAFKNDLQIRQDVSTWAQVFREAGYRTGYAGKWHLDGNPKRPGWDIRGRDMGWGDRTAMYSFGHYKTIRRAPGAQYPEVSNAVASEPGEFPTDWFTDRALEFIGKHKNESFCYMLSIPDPHGPYLARAPYDTMYPPSAMKLPQTLTEAPKSDYFLYNETRLGVAGDDDEGESENEGEQANKAGENDKKNSKKNNKKNQKKAAKSEYDQIVKTLPKAKAQYYGMIKCIDDNVGRIIAYLKENNLYDNTIIVFTADHGDMMGEHARMAKAVPFDSAARVPFIIRYPAKIAPGTICDHIASSIDFYPTLLALAGIRQDVRVSGKSMVPILTNAPESKTWTDKAFYRCYSQKYPWVGVVTKDYKLIYGKNDVRNKALLIDRQNDPAETANLIDSPAHAAIIKTLSQEILAYCQAHGDPHAEWLEKRLKD